jgi:hypothetical protein
MADKLKRQKVDKDFQRKTALMFFAVVLVSGFTPSQVRLYQSRIRRRLLGGYDSRANRRRD